MSFVFGNETCFRRKKLNIQFGNGASGRNKKGRRNRWRWCYTGTFVRERLVLTDSGRIEWQDGGGD